MPFKTGFTESTVEISQARIEDIRFEVPRVVTGTGARPHLVAAFNVKNLADHAQRLFVSIALFSDAKKLLCAGQAESPRFGVRLESKEARNLRIDFGECGANYLGGGTWKFFQVGIYARIDG